MPLRAYPRHSYSLSAGMQVLMAFTLTAFLMGMLVHMTGTTDVVLRGVQAKTMMQAQGIAVPLAAPDEPTTSDVLKEILSKVAKDVDVEELTADDSTFSVEYNGHKLHPGSFIPMIKAATAPNVTVDREGAYTWILIDIDAPDPADPSHAPFLHAITANLGKSTDDGDSGPVPVVSYFPVSPPTGAHRYVSLLFQQLDAADKDELSGYEDELKGRRPNFDVADYVDRENLAFVAYSYFYSTPQHHRIHKLHIQHLVSVTSRST
ncbi:hypothetical protein Poli38472_007475 [Pythium oligandrum]|uniref:PEBP-like protein n=1 Tax=Pythium oligandrum TaxID=41045 RepID=A0A8K1CRT7_PYTOL|nr:hypothetical protein Poli38472_007475 [Pythium oligandrum]|eukprot:TMW67803.1 hypothetical protein Poli38472_007475 [Pythium oligandrum]